MVDENTNPNVQGQGKQEDDKSKIKKRNNKYTKKKKNGKFNSSQTKTSNFKGTISEMNGHNFKCHGELYSASQFHCTMEELQSYVTQVFKYRDDICFLVRHLKEVDIEKTKPSYPPQVPRLDSTGAQVNDSKGNPVFDDPDKTDVRIWEKEVDKYVKHTTLYKQNKSALYMVIWSQCSEAMQAKLKSLSGYKVMDEERDCLKLLVAIKNIAYKFESQGKYVYAALHEAKSAFYRFGQGRYQSNSTYLTCFQSLFEVITHYGGSIGNDPILVRDEMRRNGVVNYESIPVTDLEYTKRIKAAQKPFLAISFLKGADPQRFQKLVTDLENQYTRGNNQYPKDVTGAYNLLVDYKGGRNERNNSDGGKQLEGDSSDEEKLVKNEGKLEKMGVTFVQDSKNIIKNPILNAKGDPVVCFACGGNHFANSPKCPYNKEQDKSKDASEDYFSVHANIIDTIIFLTSCHDHSSISDFIYISLLEDIGIAKHHNSTIILETRTQDRRITLNTMDK